MSYGVGLSEGLLRELLEPTSFCHGPKKVLTTRAPTNPCKQSLHAARFSFKMADSFDLYANEWTRAALVKKIRRAVCFLFITAYYYFLLTSNVCFFDVMILPKQCGIGRHEASLKSYCLRLTSSVPTSTYLAMSTSYLLQILN